MQRTSQTHARKEDWNEQNFGHRQNGSGNRQVDGRDDEAEFRVALDAVRMGERLDSRGHDDN